MATYSFTDTRCTLTGPGAVIPLGNGAGVAGEGITFSHTEEKDTVVTGADGTIMHSLHATMTGRIMVRLLKTSPANGLLSQLYNYQRTGGGAYWGQNVISITQGTLGDIIGGTQMAFTKHPDVVYATEGNMNDWEFSGYIVPELGVGIAGLTPAA